MARLGRPVEARDLVHEVADQFGDVLAPLGEARHADGHHAEPMQQVFAETPGRDLGHQVRRSTRSRARRHARASCRRRAGNSGPRARAGSCPASRAACRRLRRDRACRHAPLRARPPCGPCRRRPPTPKSSISMFSGVMVAALMATKGPFERVESPWSVRAASSLPLPGAPAIITRALVGATRSMVWRNWCGPATRRRYAWPAASSRAAP